jgi:hypothetical protein
VLVRGFPSEEDKGEAAHGVALLPMLPMAATPSRSRSAPVVDRPLGDVPVDTVVVVPPGWLPGGVLPGWVLPQLAVQPCAGN